MYRPESLSVPFFFILSLSIYICKYIFEISCLYQPLWFPRLIVSESQVWQGSFFGSSLEIFKTRKQNTLSVFLVFAPKLFSFETVFKKKKKKSKSPGAATVILKRRKRKERIKTEPNESSQRWRTGASCRSGRCLRPSVDICSRFTLFVRAATQWYPHTAD